MRRLLITLLLAALVVGCTDEPQDAEPGRVSGESERSGTPDPAPADPSSDRVYVSDGAVSVRAPNPLIRETCYDSIDNCRTFAQAEGLDHAILRFERVPTEGDRVRFYAEYGSGVVNPDYRIFDANGTELPFRYTFMLEDTWANSTSLFDAQRGTYQVFLWMPQGAEQEFQVRFEAYDFPAR